MAFSTDADLLKFQPYVFEHGVAAFVAYHDDAKADIIRDIQTFWLPAQLYFSAPSRPSTITGTQSGALDEAKLNPAQWLKASVYKVLAAYVLPSLAASVGGEGFVSMIAFYERQYIKELQNVFAAGVQYMEGSQYVTIYARLQAEPLRMQR